MGPLPPRGWPRGLTTRPIMAGPAGTCMMRRVRLTTSPSRTRWLSPRRTTPTFSSSRFRARPKTPRGTPRSSLAMTRPRPQPFLRARRQRHGRGDLVGHDAVLLAPGLGKRVHDPRQELQALVVEEEGEEARRLRARPGAGHDLVEDGLFFRGVDERADERPAEVLAGDEEVEKGPDVGSDGLVFPLVPERLGQAFGAFFNASPT